MNKFFHWLLFVIALSQFLFTAFPPGNADLISIQSLAFDLSQHDSSLLYPGKDFSNNEQWVEHHTANLKKIGSHGEPNWCFYPPLIPYLASGFASANSETWRLTWAAFQILLLFVFVLLIERLLVVCNGSFNPPKVLIFALVLGSYPIARDFQLGQTSLLIAVLLWSGIYFGLSHRAYRRAMLIGFAAFIKPFLLIVEVVYLLRKRIGPAVAVIIAVLLFFVWSVWRAGWSAHLEYFSFMKTLGDSQTAFYGNQSLLAGLMKLFTDEPIMDYGFQHNLTLTLFSKFIFLIPLAIAGFVQWKSQIQDDLLTIGLWLSAVLLALPISWEHHLIFLLPVLAYLWTRADSRNAKLLLASCTVLLSIKFTHFYSESFSGRLIASFPLFGNLILFILLTAAHLNLNSPLFSKLETLLETDVRP